MHLHSAVDSVQDLVDLGLDTMTSKVVFKLIALWKEKGLPLKFNPSSTLSSPSPSHAAVAADPAAAPDVADPSDKKLDDDFISARFLRSRAATDRIIAAAETGNPLAEAYLSDLYDRHDSLVGKDSVKAIACAEKALPWLRHHAHSGNKYALYHMASCYFSGRGLTKDEKEAARYYKLAADQGHADAQCCLGVSFANGAGVPKNVQEAARYYKLAADQGHAEAQCCLGVCYDVGEGVPKNVAAKSALTSKKGFFKSVFGK